MTKSLLSMISIFILAFLSSAGANELLPVHGPIMLDGMHKISPGDDEQWRFPEFDDSKWQSVKVPGSWQSQGFRPRKGMGWYRLRFRVPENFKGIQTAILLGRIGDVDEVYLNGVKIGGEGLIGKRFVEATKVQRLYRAPSGLLRFGSANILAIRVMNTYLNGGIFDRGSMVGDYGDLLIEKMRRERNGAIMEFCFFTLFAMFFLACFFFFIKGVREKEYIFFWLFLSLYGLLFILGSVTFYNAGLKNAFAQQVINVFSTCMPAILIILFVQVYQLKYNFPIKTVLTAYLLLSLIEPVLADYGSRTALLVVWKILFILTAGYILFLSVNAYLRRFSESGPILLGVLGLVLGLILESIGGLDLLQTTGFFLWDYSAIFFMICVMYALASRYARIQKELRHAAVNIFAAHEDERRRVSRELHDGVGQSLLSIKLKLKMLGAKSAEGCGVDDAAVSELITDVSRSIEELRSVAADLRPAYMENAELADAICWHAKSVQDTTGIEVNLEIQPAPGIDQKVKENVYRIFQEALSNVVQHSGARRVGVSLRLKDGIMSLKIEDDGSGFDTARKGDGKKGIGLYTIRERVELLGGIMRVKSATQKGTALTIEVPVK